MFLTALSLSLPSFSQDGGDIPPPPPPPPPPSGHHEVLQIYQVDQMPIYPGCDAAADPQTINDCFQKGVADHILNHVVYPEIAKDMELEGTVYVSFVVNKTGQVEKAKVIRGVSKNLDEQAILAVESLPDMTPGKQRGKNVGVMLRVPVKFKMRL